MNAPVLYQIAEDLNKMQVLANIDEADVGRMRPGQQVTFRVDAYPTERFTGTVQQVRLQPTVVQNVVVYSTVISVPNPDLKLKPGMTANVEIEIARKSNVLRVPAAATRFRPNEQMFVVLNQEVPPEARPGGGRGTGRGAATRGGRGDQTGREGAAPGQAAQGTSPAAAPQSGAPQRGAATSEREARGGGDRAEGGGRGGFDPNMSPDERRRRFEERMANMSPEERERFQRMREQRGGASPGERSAQGFGRRDMSRGIAGGVSGGSAVESGATTIDALFAPLPTVESRGRVWLYIDKQLKPISVRLGISDGTFTELLSGDLSEGQEVVVNMVTGLESRTPTSPGQTGNPLMGPQRGGRGGGRR
jgi:HlyD family secretion protein